MIELEISIIVVPVASVVMSAMLALCDLIEGGK